MQEAGITDVDVNVAGPFRARRLDSHYIITNDFGDWLFLTPDELKHFVQGEISEGDELYGRLKEKRFIHGTLDLNQAAERYRAQRWFLDHGPRTHWLALCGAEGAQQAMSSELLDRAVDCAFMSTSPELVFELTGHPLENWAGVERVTSYIESKNKLARKRVSIVLRSSLEGLDDARVDFIAKQGLQVCAQIAGSNPESWAEAKGWLPKLSEAYADVDADTQRLYATIEHVASASDEDDLNAVIDFALAMDCQSLALEPLNSIIFGG